jgi:PPOX class probable F420-dependent enzyme
MKVKKMKNLPDEFQDLVLDETKAFAYISTLMSDGSPQVTPVWFNTKGENILINTAKGRVKDRNMRARPEVAIAIQDPKNPYRYIQIRGSVIGTTEEGADAHIDFLAKKYLDKDKYPFRRPGEVRVIFTIAPRKIQANV